jgi:hypothetical protein
MTLSCRGIYHQLLCNVNTLEIYCQIKRNYNGVFIEKKEIR